MSVRLRQAGFTIIELLVASSVFSVILLLSATAMIQIGKTYYKGITEARTQETARDILSGISQAVQFSGGDIATITPNSNTKGFCIGSTRYSYIPGKLYAKTPTGHAFVMDSDCSSKKAQDLDSGGLAANSTELLGVNMRLDNNPVVSAIAATPGLYSVNVTVLYGDDDLIQNGDGSTPYNSTNTPHNCLPTTKGGQFCAMSELDTVVKKRIQ
jgi:prepilin-type N-terminal cleavage/methylation domain-containing protein